MKSNLLPIMLFTALPHFLSGQTMETFENVTAVLNNKPVQFLSNSQLFDITTGNCNAGGIFGVWVPGQSVQYCTGSSTNDNIVTYGVGTSCSGGNCTGTSTKFIDNGPATGVNQVYGIKTNNGAAFTIKSMFIYLSTNGSTTPSDAGGVTITGRLAGSTVFTYTKTTGFNTGFTVNNGFTYLDFSSGTNYTNSNIDELQIQSPNANYVAIDNFTWGASVPLPLGLLSFDLKQSDNNVQLKWNTTKQSEIAQYQVERSFDGKSFSILDDVAPNQSGNYQFIDARPFSGDNFYRLGIVSKSGEVTYSEVKNVSISSKNNTNGLVYPNPTTGTLFAKITGNAVWNIQIVDLAGRTVISAKLSAERNRLDMASLQDGVYFYKANDAATGALIAQGKISKL